MLHDIMQCQIHEPNVGFFVRLNQTRTQMVDCGKIPIIIALGKVLAVEERPLIVRVRGIAILGM